MTSLPNLWLSKIHYPDPPKSPTGAWIFDATQDFASKITALQSVDETLTIAQSFEKIGAVWDSDFFDRIHISSPGVSHAHCADTSRSARGAWLLPLSIPIEARVRELKIEDEARSTAECFRLLGATWCADWFGDIWELSRRNRESVTNYLYFDPQRTKVERCVVPIPNAEGVEEMRSGAWFEGAWGMTFRMKERANELKKREGEGVEWGECYERVGGMWSDWNRQHVLDEGGRTAEEIIWERHDDVRVV